LGKHGSRLRYAYLRAKIDLPLRTRYAIRALTFATILLCNFDCRAQTGKQFWAEWQTSYPFANRYLAENTFNYQTLLSGGEKWTTWSTSPTFEFALTPRIELTSEVPLGWTQQTSTVSTFEVSPMAGVRYHITQGKRLDTRIWARAQSRNLHHIEADTWEHNGRFRVRGEVWFSINGPNLFTNKLVYSFLDYEEFIVADQQVTERFANQRRARLGLGYRLSYTHRFDLIYTWQYSRDELSAGFTQSDSIITLKYKLYLNPATSP